ncbi:unnamed protein product [Prunus armeniaca]|uniref:Uncharacterized protein n=1 Tax=Prunus armeniaca TaxID=36596 RepID=A0A6J5WZ82_PRUAR|nr:unnamed protein product [Prunus armeniaca]
MMSVKSDHEWRPLKHPNKTDISPLRQHVPEQQSLGPNQIAGAAHTVEVIRDGQDLFLEVQSLDLSTECYFTTRVPQGVFGNLEKVCAFLWNQRLAVADIAGEALNVLVLEDAGAKSQAPGGWPFF